jgi:hypothetical protein
MNRESLRVFEVLNLFRSGPQIEENNLGQSPFVLKHLGGQGRNLILLKYFLIMVKVFWLVEPFQPQN